MSLTTELKEFADASAKRHPKEVQIIMKKAIDDLVASQMIAQAFKTGDSIPEITLKNALGNNVSIQDILKEHKVIIAFYRGNWCPYCNIQLRALQQAVPAFEAKGAKLVVISPETPDNSLSTKEKNELTFEVLSDIDMNIARSMNLVYKLPPDLQELYKKFGIDLDASQGNEHQELPIAATYIVEQDGTISYHFLEEDYKLRADPKEILEAL
ncbi:peroxiredoxin-like family protein [Kordia algicida OT-1]|uniref:thioredoxin-dependent peroxiredoxin n=1 Tax=Kordia algicida OT-1 TaxID=391587 RepID=A9EBC3_9FLAO|nr:peroxiredoxin-like family protein [Kordia algicida]EDP94455.1 Redoxin domain protein [Kordia algicida OT-1]